jgi:hypothetical protein
MTVSTKILINENGDILVSGSVLATIANIYTNFVSIFSPTGIKRAFNYLSEPQMSIGQSEIFLSSISQDASNNIFLAGTATNIEPSVINFSITKLFALDDSSSATTTTTIAPQPPTTTTTTIAPPQPPTLNTQYVSFTASEVALTAVLSLSGENVTSCAFNYKKFVGDMSFNLIAVPPPGQYDVNIASASASEASGLIKFINFVPLTFTPRLFLLQYSWNNGLYVRTNIFSALSPEYYNVAGGSGTYNADTRTGTTVVSYNNIQGLRLYFDLTYQLSANDVVSFAVQTVSGEWISIFSGTDVQYKIAANTFNIQATTFLLSSQAVGYINNNNVSLPSD